MRMLRCRWVFAVWLVSLFLGTAAEAALTWRVDFNGAAGDTLSTSNFTGWIVSSTSRTQVLANVDGGAISSNAVVRLLPVTGGTTWSTYERVMNAGTATNLYRDGMQYNSAGGGLAVSVTNLTPGIAYAIRLWYFDDEYTLGTVQNYVDVTGGGSVSIGSLTNVATGNLAAGNAGLPNSLYDSRYCIYAEITASASGEIAVSVTPTTAANAKVNALEVTALGAPPVGSLAYSSTTFTEASANNGTVTNTLTLTLSGETFTGNNGDDFINLGKATAGNVPSGLQAVLTRQSSSVMILSLTGAASAHGAADSINNLSLTFGDTAFTLGSVTNVSGYARTNLVVTFYDPLVRSLAYSATTFTESAADDGSISNTLTLTLSNEQFTGSNGEDLILSGKAVAGNVPAGLTAVLIRQDTTTAVLSLTGQATANAATNSISNMSLTFADTAFVGGGAAGVSGYSRTDLYVNFNGLVIEGPMDGVFIAWSSFPGATYRIMMSTNLTAANGGFVPVVTNIPATPAYNRRYVAPSGANTEFYRVEKE